MSTQAMGWRWQPRRVPAEPQAAVAWGEAARRLHARLLLIPEEQAARLQVTANRDVLVVSGVADDLPWVDGVEYAVADERAPGLWLSTSWEPDVPTDLLGQALSTTFSRSPLLLWRDPPAVIPLDRQLPVTPQHLQRIDAYWAER
ncbi:MULTISPECIES: bpX5 domain-containing protein [Gammaproteobacteria]|uniref:bpX5 domain-containing protein n=1 Tax=Gammaproteobacteria TaxID=1236 RepID=UPI001912614F|nr:MULTISPECIES: hypothetical protein [Gammaproteobacteria]MBK5301349.1 hypothetical protein [Bacillus sp. TH86]MBK5321118.1 hypothetical protein [Bacillus sp. TH59]MBK5336068.1 hypothetical protein [Bacillus sp. TH57]MBK5310137.1 hypothetical protein [Pseudomonas sp. TH71]MBK5315616.1 hypothetical protein [Erwinia sp. TH79]